MGRIPAGLQLYSLRSETAQDFVGTVRKVAEAGYDGVEFAGYGGLSAVELKKLLDELNLKPAGAHAGLESLEKDIKGIIDFSREIGNINIIVPGLGENRRNSKEAWLATADVMNKVGAVLKENGLQLSYHNHAFEFEMVDGEPAYDLFFSAMDPDLVKVELDIYWVAYAGLDPAEYVRKYAPRLFATHLKEMSRRPDRHDTALGHGIINWDAVFNAADNSTISWHIVEQENYEEFSPLDGMRASLEYLRSRGMV